MACARACCASGTILDPRLRGDDGRRGWHPPMSFPRRLESSSLCSSPWASQQFNLSNSLRRSTRACTVAAQSTLAHEAQLHQQQAIPALTQGESKRCKVCRKECDPVGEFCKSLHLCLENHNAPRHSFIHFKSIHNVRLCCITLSPTQWVECAQPGLEACSQNAGPCIFAQWGERCARSRRKA